MNTHKSLSLTYRTKCSIGSTLDEALVVGIDIGCCYIIGSHFPVIRVIFPDNRSEAETFCNGTYAIVDVTKRRLSKNVFTHDLAT